MFSSQNTHPTSLVVTSRARPKRVAFLVDPVKTSDNDLNQIICYSLGIWGGRFHAIIPTSGSDILGDWWNLLKVIDPDIIYSLIPLQEELIRRINRHILPARIFCVTQDDHRYWGGIIRIREDEIGAYGIEGIPSYVWLTRDSYQSPHFVCIRDAASNTEDNAARTLMIRNFGVLPQRLSIENVFRDFSMNSEIMQVVSTEPLEILSDLKRARRRLVYPVDLCRLFSPGHYWHEGDAFSTGLHLVVGDSPLDTIYAWNRSLTSGGIVGLDVFWLSNHFWQDDESLRTVSLFLKNRLWNSDNGMSSKIISYSIDMYKLEAISEKIKEFILKNPERDFFNLKPHKLTADQFPLGRIQYPPTFDKQSELISLSGGRGQLHIQRSPFLQQDRPHNGWMIDLEIQYSLDAVNMPHDMMTNWRLPKREAVANLFFTPHRQTRIIKDGIPSGSVASHERNLGNQHSN